MESEPVTNAQTWRTTHGDMTDEEWDLISDLVAPYWKPGRMGRPVTVERRDIVNAIFYVAATGCQWRALPECYPNWNTVHRYHLTWSRDGTWAKIAGRLAGAVLEREGRDAEPSAGIVDARTVRGTSTVTGDTRGYDAAKKNSGGKTFGIVDTLGLLLAVTVVAANTSDNTGGTKVADAARALSTRFRRLWSQRRVQKDLHRTLPYPPRRRRSREPYPHAPVRGPPQTLDHRTDLVVADEQPPPPSRL